VFFLKNTIKTKGFAFFSLLLLSSSLLITCASATTSSDSSTDSTGSSDSGDESTTEAGKDPDTTDSGTTGGLGEETDSGIAPPGLASCSNDPLFTVSPTDLKNICGIVPIGNLNPTGHTLPTRHLYLYLPDANGTCGVDKSGQFSVYAPGDVTMSHVTEQKNLTQDTTDYSISFYPCAEFKWYFYHLSSLQNAIKTQIGAFRDDECRTYTTGGENYQNCSKAVNFDIRAGDTIGTVGGTTSQAFDFGAMDARVNALAFANPSRIEQQEDKVDALHMVCPLDYFELTVRDQLKAKLGSYDGVTKRTAKPVCGEFEQDEAGTAQGIWFIEGTEGVSNSEDKHLALVHHNVDPTIGAFSVGTSVSDLSSNEYNFTPTSSGKVDREFSEVTSDGSVYCYEMSVSGSEVIFLIQLTNATTLKMEKQDTTSCGSGPWSFTANAAVFER